ncbi:MAG: hypothetical protein WA892_05615 [Ornithinimicrobium sp.]
MRIDRECIVAMLRNRGHESRARQAQYSLPPVVDTEVHREPLVGLELYEEDLAWRFGPHSRPYS